MIHPLLLVFSFPFPPPPPPLHLPRLPHHAVSLPSISPRFPSPTSSSSGLHPSSFNFGPLCTQIASVASADAIITSLPVLAPFTRKTLNLYTARLVSLYPFVCTCVPFAWGWLVGRVHRSGRGWRSLR